MTVVILHAGDRASNTYRKDSTVNKNGRFPNRLKEIREALDITQEQVSIALGIGQSAISRHERMNRSLSGIDIERYARFYGVFPYEIFVEPIEDRTNSLISGPMDALPERYQERAREIIRGPAGTTAPELIEAS
jgi:transcriptional regulator with XRE-family HTH domain